MDDGRLDAMLQNLAAGPAETWDDDLTARVWRNVDELERRQQGRGQFAFTFGMMAIALVGGLGVAQKPAEAREPSAGLFGEMANSPANLLHVLP